MVQMVALCSGRLTFYKHFFTPQQFRIAVTPSCTRNRNICWWALLHDQLVGVVRLGHIDVYDTLISIKAIKCLWRLRRWNKSPHTQLTWLLCVSNALYRGVRLYVNCVVNLSIVHWWHRVGWGFILFGAWGRGWVGMGWAWLVITRFVFVVLMKIAIPCIRAIFFFFMTVTRLNLTVIVWIFTDIPWENLFTCQNNVSTPMTLLKISHLALRSVTGSIVGVKLTVVIKSIWIKTVCNWKDFQS